MTKCDYCGKETKITYICSKCKGSYCKEHRLPENHNCTLLNKKIIEISPIPVIKEENIRHIKSEVMNEPIIKPLIKKEIKTEKKAIDLLSSNYFLIKATILIISLLINIYFYYDINSLKVEYTELYEDSLELQSYYNNLTIKYNELRSEYSQINDLYKTLMEEKLSIEQEYADIMEYRKDIQIESFKTITLGPKDNYTEIYSLPFTGLVNLNYTASGDTYAWIGSTNITDLYYSRNPQFPHTAIQYNCTVPVMPDLMVYFGNPSETNSIELTYSIEFTY